MPSFLQWNEANSQAHKPPELQASLLERHAMPLRSRKLTALLFCAHTHSSALIYGAISDLKELGLE